MLAVLSTYIALAIVTCCEQHAPVMLEKGLLSGPRAIFCLASTRHDSSHPQDISQGVHKNKATLLFHRRLSLIAASAGTVLGPPGQYVVEQSRQNLRSICKVAYLAGASWAA